MKTRIILSIVALALVGVACTAPSPDKLGVKSFEAQEVIAEEVPATTAPAAVSTCDVAREAFLTGGPADVTAALAALKADVTADATAREYADYYLHRDAGDADMREMDKSLIQTSCSF